MNDVTVACSCGRAMTPDVMAGRGAFRCGCGARITVTVTRTATCIGIGEDGERCRTRPIRESAKAGMSLCRQHFEGYLSVLDLIGRAERATQLLEPEKFRIPEPDPEEARRWEKERRRYAEQSVVYYVRIGETIKIGTTVNMKARMGGLMIDEVLATEPGDRQLEAMRHKQFRHLRIRGERFRPEPDLMSHIAMIREHCGEPKMTSYLKAS